MVKLTEGRQDTEGLLSEADFAYSREAITILSGAGKLEAGAVLGKITASGKYKPSTDTGSDGAQVASAILLYGVDATSADVQVTAIVRAAQWNVSTLSYDASVSDGTKKAAKIAQLKTAGIICR
jgi:hypothetical protein